jgi:hypothetical protein
MDTGSVQNILGVATQGRGDGQPQWVGSYKVSVSNDEISWVAVDGGFTFTGNTVQGDAIVRNNFAAVVTARYVRIEPKSFNQNIAMRAGVYVAVGTTLPCISAPCPPPALSHSCPHQKSRLRWRTRMLNGPDALGRA